MHVTRTSRGEISLLASGGREVGISSDGLPSSLRVRGRELLASPVRLTIRQGGQPLLHPLASATLQRRRGGQGWSMAAPARLRQAGGSSGLLLNISGSMRSDGLVEMVADIYNSPLSRTEEMPISDVRLEMPLVADHVSRGARRE